MLYVGVSSIKGCLKVGHNRSFLRDHIRDINCLYSALDEAQVAWIPLVAPNSGMQSFLKKGAHF